MAKVARLVVTLLLWPLLIVFLDPMTRGNATPNAPLALAWAFGLLALAYAITRLPWWRLWRAI